MSIKQVQSYIDNNLNPDKINVIDPTKDNFSHPLSVKEIDLEISKDGYYRTLSISTDEDLELHLKRKPNSCFVVGLKAWQGNMDIQPVLTSIKQ